MLIYVEKSEEVLLQALIDHLRILGDEIVTIGTEKKFYRIKVISASLRALVCDKSNGASGGILTYFIKKYEPKLTILSDNKQIPIDNWLKEVIYKKQGPLSNIFLNRCQIIKSFAQEDGLAHESLRRKKDYYEARAILEIGISYKTNPIVGLFLEIAKQVFNLIIPRSLLRGTTA